MFSFLFQSTPSSSLNIECEGDSQSKDEGEDDDKGKTEGKSDSKDKGKSESKSRVAKPPDFTRSLLIFILFSWQKIFWFQELIFQNSPDSSDLSFSYFVTIEILSW